MLFEAYLKPRRGLFGCRIVISDSGSVEGCPDGTDDPQPTTVDYRSPLSTGATVGVAVGSAFAGAALLALACLVVPLCRCTGGVGVRGTSFYSGGAAAGSARASSSGRTPAGPVSYFMRLPFLFMNRSGDSNVDKYVIAPTDLKVFAYLDDPSESLIMPMTQPSGPRLHLLDDGDNAVALQGGGAVPAAAINGDLVIEYRRVFLLLTPCHAPFDLFLRTELGITRC